MNTIIFSTDVDLLQSQLIVFQNNTCLYIDYDYDNENYIVYCFDLLTSVDSWINLNDVNSYSDSNYTNELSENDFIHFTNDVCSYYGAINFDGCPTTYNENKLLELINEIQSNEN